MTEQEAVVPSVPVQSVSRTLVEARERLGLSQKEVADRLYLTTTFIRYIDDGEFDRIPTRAFIKGYLRSYARVVELSGDDIVAMYDAELEATEPAPEIRGVTEENVGTSAITGPVMQTGVIAIIVLALVVTGIWFMVARPEKEPVVTVTQPSVMQPSEEEPAAGEPDTDFGFVISETVEEPAEDAASDPGVVDDAGLAGDAALEAARDIISQTGESDAPELAEVSIERTSSGTRSFIKVDAGGFDQLEITFPDECWVEIEDDSRGLVYSDLNRAGEVLTVYGTAPFTLLLGKASGVEMLYNGRPFDLTPYVGQDNTAKVTVAE